MATRSKFPLIMAMLNGKKHYEKLDYLNEISRADIAVLGFYPGWSGNGMTVRDVLSELKSRNPELLIGQYTILGEAPDALDSTSADTDKGRKLDKEDWWVRDSAGNRVQWTPLYGAYDTNITLWAPEKNGIRYSEWLARRDSDKYFRPQDFDIWFFDNVFDRPAVDADWDRDGTNDSRLNETVAAAFREGHARHWEEARSLQPRMFMMGNAADLSSKQYSKKLNAAFLEALIGLSWSLEQTQGWEAVLARYSSAMKHTLSPHLVGFNVHGEKNDYQKMRYGLTTCLLDDGYYCYTDVQVGYSSVPWFDEYDVDLGKPIDPPPAASWSNGVYRRRYKNGVVLVNPTSDTKIVNVGPGYERIKGSQDTKVNSGEKTSTIALNSKDGIILRRQTHREGQMVFVESKSVRTMPTPATVRIYFRGVALNTKNGDLYFGNPDDINYSMTVPIQARESHVRSMAIAYLSTAFSVKPTDVRFLTF